jgi:hypothetical protein
MLKQILGKLLGPSPATTIIGGVVAALMVVQEAMKSGAPVDWVNILIAAGVAALGFKSSDASKPQA